MEEKVFTRLGALFAEGRQIWDNHQDIERSTRLDEISVELETILLNQYSAPTQDQFVKYMGWAAEASWDIPSALGAVCQHSSRAVNGGDFFMHRGEYWPQNNWEVIDKHFSEVHGLDLTDSRINWSFDT